MEYFQLVRAEHTRDESKSPWDYRPTLPLRPHASHFGTPVESETDGQQPGAEQSEG